MFQALQALMMEFLLQALLMILLVYQDLKALHGMLEHSNMFLGQ